MCEQEEWRMEEGEDRGSKMNILANAVMFSTFLRLCIRGGAAVAGWRD